MREKIGMYTEDEIFEYMTDCEGSMLGRSMYDAIFDKIHALITEKEQLQQENQQLKEKNENQFNDLMKRIHSNNDKHLEESDKLIKENFQLKEVIEEVREYMKKHPCDTWYYSKKKSDKFFDIEIIRCDEELLQILDKVKEQQ